MFTFDFLDGKVSKTPRRPFEKERLDVELKLCGEYGLRNKREIWRVGRAVSKIRAAARQLLTLPEKDPKRLFEGRNSHAVRNVFVARSSLPLGAALLRRLHRYGIIDETQSKLDYILALKVNDFLERRLQTQVFKLGLAKSIHHARVLIKQRHIVYVLCTLIPKCDP